MKKLKLLLIAFILAIFAGNLYSRTYVLVYDQPVRAQINESSDIWDCLEAGTHQILNINQYCDVNATAAMFVEGQISVSVIWARYAPYYNWRDNLANYGEMWGVGAYSSNGNRTYRTNSNNFRFGSIYSYGHYSWTPSQLPYGCAIGYVSLEVIY